MYSIAPESREKGEDENPFPEFGGLLHLRRWRPIPATEPPEVAWREVRQHLDVVSGTSGRAAIAYFPWIDHGFLEPRLTPERLDEEMPFVWGGLVLRPLARPPGLFDRTSQREQLLRSRRCAGMHLLNEDMCRYYEGLMRGRFVGVFPDVTDLTTDPARRLFRALTLPDLLGEPTFIFSGNICLRKGFDWFVEAANRARKRKRRWRFFAIGAFSVFSVSSPAEYRRIAMLLEKKPGVTMTAFPARIPDADINAMLRQSAAVWCHYRDFPWSSNVMVKAAAFEVPLIAADRGVIASRTRAYALGELAQEGCAAAIDQALTLLADRDWRVHWRKRQRCAEFASQHSSARLRAALESWLLSAEALERAMAT
ncbi:MAG: glycosyltransferase [Opitutaceae bacterium]